MPNHSVSENVSPAGVGVSVVVCTHNPNLSRLAEVLSHLRSQTLSQDRWELFVIDNRSEKPLESQIDLSWHKNGRVVREDKLGLTWARVRGINESKNDLIIYVDDDNLLAPDYLEEALNVSKLWPMIGVWGGQVELQFETPPPDWTRPYWFMLAFRKFNRDVWANTPDIRCLPCGAGMCIRKVVAEKYVHAVLNDPKRQALDRRGDSLSSAGDTDLVYTACEIGLGTGQSTRLKLNHIIPAFRLTAEYFLKLQEGMSFSDVVLKSVRPGPVNSGPMSVKEKLIVWFRFVRLSAFDKKMSLADKRGRKRAETLLRENALVLSSTK